MILNTVIFGLNDYADMAHWYLTNDSHFKPVAFCVNEKYIDRDMHKGLPVMPAEYVVHYAPPWSNNFFAPLMDNKFRREVFVDLSAMGYNMISYISSKANVSGKVGRNCFVQEYNNIQPFSVVGDNCVLWAGNHIGHHSEIGEDTTITSHVVISGHVKVGAGCYFGVNSTVRDGISIADGSVIGQAANVVSDLRQPNSVYLGNPAKLYKQLTP